MMRLVAVTSKILFDYKVVNSALDNDLLVSGSEIFIDLTDTQSRQKLLCLHENPMGDKFFGESHC